MTFDIVILGATGFTGKNVAKELLRSLSFSSWPNQSHFTWGVAGRSRSNLEKLREELKKENNQISGANVPEIIITDISDDLSIMSMAKLAKLVINCAGPFRFLGESVVKACVECGADYLDISGEPEFIERMVLKYHEKAVAAGVTVISAAAFDSVPCELGVLAAKRYMLSKGITPSSIEMFLQIYSKKLCIHYPTYHSAVEGFAHSGTDLKAVRKKLAGVMPKPYPHGPIPKCQKPRREGFLDYVVGKFGIVRDERVSGWVTPYFFSDPSIVRLSQSYAILLKMQNNPPVHFYAYLVIRNTYALILFIIFFTLFCFLTQRQYGRYLLLKFPELFTFNLVSREGPSQEIMDGTRFVQEFYAKGHSEQIVQTPTTRPDHLLSFHLSGPELGYVATPIIIVQCARQIQIHKDKITKGVVTPAIAFFDEDIKLLEELCKDGRFSWEVVSA